MDDHRRPFRCRQYLFRSSRNRRTLSTDPNEISKDQGRIYNVPAFFIIPMWSPTGKPVAPENAPVGRHPGQRFGIHPRSEAVAFCCRGIPLRPKGRSPSTEAQGPERVERAFQVVFPLYCTPSCLPCIMPGSGPAGRPGPRLKAGFAG
jgi:hypothetical protein